MLTENALKLLKEKNYFKEGESKWEDICNRVSRAISFAESNKSISEQMRLEIYGAMLNFEFIFSTPCLLNADMDNPGQLSSCFVTSTKDTIEDICRTDAEFAKIFQKNGGAGTDLSVLRPSKSIVHTSKGYAGGIITFMEKFDYTADNMTKFNPSRKGALKINIKDSHPEIYDFIHCKDDLTKLNRMNISVSLSDNFMSAVVNDLDWDLEFPEYEKCKDIYNQEWDGNIIKWKEKGYPVKKYKTIKAKELLGEIAEASWKTGEPGINYQNRMCLDNPNTHISTEIYTNPCAEFSNIPYSSCNLGSINLTKCINNGIFDFKKLANLAYKATIWLDNVITVNILPLEKINEITQGIRPVGLGIMGFADTLYELGIRYNSKDGLKFANKIIKIIKENAIKSTKDLAKEKGVYPKWEGSTFYKKNIRVRNSSLLSIAPTGTISFIANVSGGIEPNFALVFTRRTYDNNIYYVLNPIFEKKLKDLGIYSEKLIKKISDNNGSCQGIKEIPEYIQDIFVTAHDLTPKEHIDMVATFQQHVDLSISKTVNFNSNATPQDLFDIYIYAWKKGLKGLSVYRDGSRDNQTLSTHRETTDINDKKEILFDSIEPIEKDDLGETFGTSIKKRVACGNLFITLLRDESGNLAEMFINTSKSGICQSNINAISRLVSIGLRTGTKVEYLCDQLIGIKCPACTILKSKGENVEASCAEAIGKYILEKYNQGNLIIKEIKPKTPKTNKTKEDKNKCLNCGEKLRMESGCMVCVCGFSKCG